MKKTISSPESKKLCAWLKEMRSAKGLSMRQLAERLQVPHSFIGKVEQGERRLDVIEFVQYCQALEVSAEAGVRIIVDCR